MTILQGDVKLVASERMTDVPEGGGAPTATVIQDGESNSVFPDISEVDRAGGNVSLRKVFVSVQTDNTDTYLGSNVIVAEPPNDPRVSITAFRTTDTFDVRDNATDRIEAYLVAAGEWPGFLLENHVQGQRSVQIFQRPSEPPPNIGQTLVLVQNEGLSNKYEQYVRVTATSSVTRTYVDENGNPYDGTVVTCSISDVLRYDFPGTAANRGFRRLEGRTRVRDTSVADAGMYAGVAKTTEAVSIGDISARVASIFTQLVPSAQAETPIVDANAAGEPQALVAAANGNMSLTTAVPFSNISNVSLGTSVVPGTLNITLATGGPLTDAAGQILDGTTVVGVIDYAGGRLSFPTLTAPYTGTKTIAFRPAAAPTRTTNTAGVEVSAESRAFNYVVTLAPTPTPGGVSVSYRAQGRWYTLVDNNAGVLRGSDASYGTGTVNYETGSVAVTLGALPDVGSAVLFSWANRTSFNVRTDIAVPKLGVEFTLDGAPLVPGSLSITWGSGADTKTATGAVNGTISGDATGEVNYLTGAVVLRPNVLPLGGTTFEVSYGRREDTPVQTPTFTDPPRNPDTTVTLDLDETNIQPGSVRLRVPVKVEEDTRNEFNRRYDYLAPAELEYRDNGTGGIYERTTNTVVGSINYTTGIVTFQPDITATVRYDEYRFAYEYLGALSASS